MTDADFFRSKHWAVRAFHVLLVLLLGTTLVLVNNIWLQVALLGLLLWQTVTTVKVILGPSFLVAAYFLGRTDECIMQAVPEDVYHIVEVGVTSVMFGGDTSQTDTALRVFREVLRQEVEGNKGAMIANFVALGEKMREKGWDLDEIRPPREETE